MPDVTLLPTVITSLVSALSAYMTYRVGMASAQKDNTPAPEKSAEAQQGEAVAQVVETAIVQHGQDEEQGTLALYQKNPKRFEGAIIEVVTDLAQRSPEFAAQLRALAPQNETGSRGGQVAIGNNIGQADRGSTVTMNVNTPKKED